MIVIANATQAVAISGWCKTPWPTCVQTWKISARTRRGWEYTCMYTHAYTFAYAHVFIGGYGGRLPAGRTTQEGDRCGQSAARAPVRTPSPTPISPVRTLLQMESQIAETETVRARQPIHSPTSPAHVCCSDRNWPTSCPSHR